MAQHKVREFAGIIAPMKKRTKKHRPAVWECLLGTVYAYHPEKGVKYFDYKWDEARGYAEVDQYTDIRLDRYINGESGCECIGNDAERPRNQLVLWVK
jgi:hypothetical protein